MHEIKGRSNHPSLHSQFQIKAMTIASRVLDGFKSIKGSPNELYKAYLLKFLDSFSYFSFSLIFTLFLSDDFGYSDLTAGTLYGVWGALVTAFGLLTGVIVDNLGVSTSLRIGFAIQLAAKILIFITNTRWILLMGMAILSFGGCLGIPVLTIGIRRYSTEKNRGFCFGLFYVIMNVAALLSGPIVDYCTILFKHTGESIDINGIRSLDEEGGVEFSNDDYKEWELTGYRLVILLGIIANVVACIVTVTVKEIKVVEDSGSSSSSNDKISKTQAFQINQASPWEIVKETLQTKDFWRFLVVVLVTLNIRMIFRHLDATLPKYMIREFGDQVPKGTIYSINPFLIIILVPIIQAATTHIDPLVMIHHGCYISAASVFFLVFSTSITSCVLFVIVLSVGEAIWSPRLYDYTCTIAKEGREGTYMALSSAPLFLAKLPVGMMSGYLLQKYCPEEGPRNSKVMWGIIAMTTATSPILLTVLWGYISKKEESVASPLQTSGRELVPLKSRDEEDDEA
jgi:POT family proton-dependent oligopeptide transporter